MSRPNRWLTSTIVVLAVAGLAQCGKGGKTKSQDVSITIIPDKPIVITADTTHNGVSVSKPWIKFAASLQNNADEHLVIVAVTAKIYVAGGTDGSDWAEDPASQSSTTNTTDCTYDRYADIDPTKTATLDLIGTAPCGESPHFFYIPSLKTTPSGGYRYKIVFKPIGWFGTFSNPTDRFENTYTFYTQ